MPETYAAALILTAAPGSNALGPETLAVARTCLARYDIIGDRTLATGEAHEFLVVIPETTDLAAIRRALASGLATPAVDVNIIPNDITWTRRKLLVADMESTIIEQEMLDELGDFIGKRAEIEDITARAMRGELDFEGALKSRVSLLAGLPETVLDDVARRITYMPGAAALVTTMKANGAYCALVSGGFTVFTGRVAARLGFDEHRANVLETADGRLTGTVRSPILGRQAKLDALNELTTKLGLFPQQTLAVGDGANDLAMIGAAGLGVAFRAKPKVRDEAASLDNGAVVTNGDLTALLHLQGYARSDFRSA
ncbi:MAG TPA: phosphoserine phosphatase SerB [Hyphomicrobiaceae bacterium]|nr:phosphoserine phosphatase SerB [Hyphomicrobiaceae bacterium]